MLSDELQRTTESLNNWFELQFGVNVPHTLAAGGPP
jgi:hypothetical protein